MSSRISNKKPEGMQEFLKKEDPAVEELRKKLLGNDVQTQKVEQQAYKTLDHT